MPFTLKPPSFLLVAGGATNSIPVTDMNSVYIITGTQTITSDNIFQESGTPTEGMTYVYDYRGIATYSGGVVKFHGTSLTAQQALKKCIVTAEYLGGAWSVGIDPNVSQSDVIESNNIKSLAYSKLTGTTQGSTIIGDASNLPVLFSLATDKGIPIGNGTTSVVRVISGVIAISNTGVATYVAGQMTAAGLAANAGVLFSQLEALASAKILVGSAGNVAVAVTPSGDWTIDNAGVNLIGAQKITISKLLATIRDNIIGAHPVKFTTGNLFTNGQLNEFTCPYNCDITFGFAEVTTLIEATDDATVIITIAGAPVTNGTITLTKNSVVGTQFSCTPTGAMSVTAGQKIGLHTAKTTSGGTADVWLTVRRT